MFDQFAYVISDVVAVDWDGPHQLVLEVTLKSAAGATVEGLGFALYHVKPDANRIVGITVLGDDVDTDAVNWSEGMLAIIPPLYGPLDDARDQFVWALGSSLIDWAGLDDEFAARIFKFRELHSSAKRS